MFHNRQSSRFFRLRRHDEDWDLLQRLTQFWTFQVSCERDAITNSEMVGVDFEFFAHRTVSNQRKVEGETIVCQFLAGLEKKRHAFLFDKPADVADLKVARRGGFLNAHLQTVV